MTVHADTVTSVQDIAINEQMDESEAIARRSWPAIDGLFAEAQQFLDSKQAQHTVALEYASQYGYPTLLATTSNKPGGGFPDSASTLQPLP